VLILGYKDDSKMPLIGEMGNDSGAYQELFSKAAEMIGYKLKIVRLPKKRLYQEIEAGTVDFYPGASFSEERAAYMCFLDNGFQTKEILITKKGVKNITDFSKVSGILLVDIGGSKENFDQVYKNIKLNKVGSLAFEQALEIIVSGRSDFYIADIEEIEYYQKLKGFKSYEDIGLTIHYNTFGDYQPMYMGFSMNSKLFKAADNPKYNKANPLSYTNTPKTAAAGCVAYQFYEALMKLKKSGETAKIHDKYFK
jgi:ABC-type amino acid transport substrate-binding protein